MRDVAKKIATGAAVACFAGAMATSAVAGQAQAASPITRPLVSEDVAPLDAIAPIARDGHRGEAFLRKPPGGGPFPAVVLIPAGE